MNTGQTIFVLFGLVLLSVFGLSINRSTVGSRVVLQNSGLISSAISVAEKYIEESELRRFDEHSSATTPNNFTYVNQLGPDTGESYPNFDDVDDYNGFSLTDNTSALIPLTVNIEVAYVNNNPPHDVASVRTNFKRIKIRVSSPHFAALPDSSVTMVRIFGYHWFWSDEWE